MHLSALALKNYEAHELEKILRNVISNTINNDMLFQFFNPLNKPVKGFLQSNLLLHVLHYSHCEP